MVLIGLKSNWPLQTPLRNPCAHLRNRLRTHFLLSGLQYGIVCPRIFNFLTRNPVYFQCRPFLIKYTFMQNKCQNKSSNSIFMHKKICWCTNEICKTPLCIHQQKVVFIYFLMAISPFFRFHINKENSVNKIETSFFFDGRCKV